MLRRVKLNAAALAVLVVGLLSVTLIVVCLVYDLFSHPSLDSQVPRTSPNGRHRVVVEEPSFRFLDRNFRLVLTTGPTGAPTPICQSSDQSPLIRKERFVWSPDSRYLALVGDRYFVVDGSAFNNCESLFLVYDLDSNTVYCNADNDGRFPRMSAASAAEKFDNQLPEPSSTAK